jgi:soluble lytic murein transglycosylase-like protein
MAKPRLISVALAVATALVLAACPGPKIKKINPDPFAASQGQASPAEGMTEPRPHTDVAPRALLPGPSRQIPRDARRLAEELEATTVALRDAIDAWRARGDPSAYPPPEDVELLALYQQRIYRVLGRDSKLANATIERLPKRLRSEARANTSAAANLFSLVTPVSGSPGFTTAKPLPAGRLLHHYRDAEQRFGVAWEVLAAVNSVETRFNRITSSSSAGAQGPMQFIPSTWAAYGLGGDIHDPRDAIMAAANYLRASGAPGDYRQALYSYNPSWDYVDAIWAYARQMMEDERDFFAYYNWQVFVLTTKGDRRLTGPGLA